MDQQKPSNNRFLSDLEYLKLVEHEHRLTVVEMQTTRLNKVVDSEDVTDSVIDRKIVRLEAQVKTTSRLIWLVVSSCLTAAIAVALKAYL